MVGGPGFQKAGVASWHMRTQCHKIPLYLGRFVLIHTRIWWVNNLHGSSPLLRHP